MDDNATTVKNVSKAFMRLVRDNMFAGQELALIEPLNGPRPGVLHCTIGFIRARPFQHPIKRWEKRGDDLFEVIRGTRYCQYRVTFFGAGAYQKAVDCQNWMKSVVGAEFTLSPIVGFGQIQEVQQATTEYLGRQEERAFFNVDLYAKFSAEFKWDNIEQVVGDVLRDGDEAIPIQIEKS